jgi:hypothetical protein
LIHGLNLATLDKGIFISSSKKVMFLLSLSNSATPALS